MTWQAIKASFILLKSYIVHLEKKTINMLGLFLDQHTSELLSDESRQQNFNVYKQIWYLKPVIGTFRRSFFVG